MCNNCLHVRRTLRKEQYSQAEIDYLFTSLVLPTCYFIYGLPVYEASEPDLNIHIFLDVISTILSLTLSLSRIY